MSTRNDYFLNAFLAGFSGDLHDRWMAYMKGALEGGGITVPEEATLQDIQAIFLEWKGFTEGTLQERWNQWIVSLLTHNNGTLNDNELEEFKNTAP